MITEHQVDHFFAGSSLQAAVERKFMANVFLWMFGALAISAATSLWVTLNFETVIPLLFHEETGKMNVLGWGVMLAPLGFVLLMSFAYQRLAVPVLIGLFVAYAAINGVSFAFILASYTQGTVIGCFAAASATFGLMALLGYTTKTDLSKFGSVMMMGLIGVVIASLINFFLQSSTMDYIISTVGVLVFTGLTAYDVQKIKNIGQGLAYEGAEAASVRKLSILGALTLYLDFVNLFLFILRIFGGRRS